ncbi:AraC-like DNA-binding protein [Paenibacillus endophyticus]|uniref:AraC-like DNA-binding protein n=1 Tax=Paenibacillus endophyticus TaxID=1294268 RepID=A0A7W5GBJ8_9BACL|nr:AraC family transcriptional regulator [Paenibacillus endophyticus]MBB3153473.1 AraC-like DNA-binding protein [Paenibacillus endophyticus]
MLVLEFQAPPSPLLAAIGYGLWQPGVMHAKRRFEVFDLLICTKGALYMEEEGCSYEILAGMVLVLEPGKTHRGYRPTEVETEVYWIHFEYSQPDMHTLLTEKTSWQQPLLKRTDQDIAAPPSTVRIPKFAAVDLRSVVPLLERMIQLHQVLTRQRAFELQVLFGEFLLVLQKGTIRNSPQARSYSLSEKVAVYLESRLEEPFDSEQMERELHYHFDYLARCLKQYTGMSPMQYRHHLQIERAKRLLAHSELPLKEIGALCGLADNTYFTRLFKRQTALTPGEYRKQNQVFL